MLSAIVPEAVGVVVSGALEAQSLPGKAVGGQGWHPSRSRRRAFHPSESTEHHKEISWYLEL